MLIDVIVPTYQPDENLIRLFDSLVTQTVNVNKIIIMNTDKDCFEAFFRSGGYSMPEQAELHHLTKKEFDHGNTRNRGVEYSKADYFLMMTQDALPADNRLVELLLNSMTDSNIACAYGRQLPREDSGIIEKLNREFNYPEVSSTKSRDDISTLGIKAYFCSNVCCCYNRKIFDSLGGFISKTIFNEDMIFAAGAINKGYSIVYNAEAKVYHSHSYSGIRQLKRNVDLGVSQADHPEIFNSVSGEKEGIRLVKSTIGKLAEAGEYTKIPGFIYNTGCRYLGYKIGRNYKHFPKGVIKRLSATPDYFR